MTQTTITPAAGEAAPQNDAAGEGQAAQQAEAAPATEMDLAYAGVSRAVTTPGEAHMALFGELHRPPVRLDATVKDPLRFREAMSALYAIVGSDYRYVPKDRTAYAAFVRMRRQSAGLGVWQARQAYFSFLLRNDPAAFVLLDPVVTVHPDQVFFEVFSKDEGTYAKLGVDLTAFDLGGGEGEARAEPRSLDVHGSAGEPRPPGRQATR